MLPLPVHPLGRPPSSKLSCSYGACANSANRSSNRLDASPSLCVVPRDASLPYPLGVSGDPARPPPPANLAAFLVAISAKLRCRRNPNPPPPTLSSPLSRTRFAGRLARFGCMRTRATRTRSFNSRPLCVNPSFPPNTSVSIPRPRSVATTRRNVTNLSHVSRVSRRLAASQSRLARVSASRRASRARLASVSTSTSPRGVVSITVDMTGRDERVRVNSLASRALSASSRRVASFCARARARGFETEADAPVHLARARRRRDARDAMGEDEGLASRRSARRGSDEDARATRREDRTRAGGARATRLWARVSVMVYI